MATSGDPQNTAGSVPVSTPAPASGQPQPQPQRTTQLHRVILEQPFGPLRKIVFFALLLALAVSVMFNFGLLGAYHQYVQTDTSIEEKLHSGEASRRNKIAVIKVSGPIMQSEGFVKKQIDRVRKDKNVKAIVLRVDSPGGTVSASHYLFHHLKKLRTEKKVPMVVSMGGLAASGGYYISMAVGSGEDTIYAEETTWTGSVGVIIPSYDFSELLEHWKVHDRSFASGEFKQMGSPTRSLSEEERLKEEAKLQELVDESFEGFKEVVAYGRPKLVADEPAMNEVTTGQIFTAKQAERLGMVDKLGYIEDAIARAAELASLTEGEYRAVEYSRPLGVLDIALGTQSGAGTSFDLASLIDMTAPRAYYLCTWLPTVAVSRSGYTLP